MPIRVFLEASHGAGINEKTIYSLSNTQFHLGEKLLLSSNDNNLIDEQVFFVFLIKFFAYRGTEWKQNSFRVDMESKIHFSKREYMFINYISICLITNTSSRSPWLIR